MPTYEYECRKCGHAFEVFHSMTEPPVDKCPKCNGPVKKLISGGAGLIFKGSGFYITDYRSKQYKDSEKKEKQVDSPAKDKSKKDKQNKD